MKPGGARAAAAEFLRRKSRASHPCGKTDGGGRWYPSDGERQACCASVRSPSRVHPWSYMTHCRSAAHVAALYGVSVTEVRRLARAEKPPKREGGEYFKVVAVVGGRFFSIFDASEYVLGVERVEAAHQNHGGGFYVHETPSEALSALVHARSLLFDAPRALLRVLCAGSYCRYAGKLAFSRITPVEVMQVSA